MLGAISRGALWGPPGTTDERSGVGPIQETSNRGSDPAKVQTLKTGCSSGVHLFPLTVRHDMDRPDTPQPRRGLAARLSRTLLRRVSGQAVHSRSTETRGVDRGGAGASAQQFGSRCWPPERRRMRWSLGGDDLAHPKKGGLPLIQGSILYCPRRWVTNLIRCQPRPHQFVELHLSFSRR